MSDFFTIGRNTLRRYRAPEKTHRCFTSPFRAECSRVKRRVNIERRG
jgi:hypothetical protein